MRGVYTALVTPMQKDGSLDLDAYKTILKQQLAAKVDGVVVCGTTGESPTLDEDEKKQLIQTALDELRGSKVKVIAGTGSNDTADSVSFSKWASSKGVDGVLVVTPYYNKPSQAGLEKHFLAVADAISCDLILYNVPGRTGVSIAPETVLRLVEHKRITTLKEATGNIPVTSDILEKLHRNQKSIDVLSGDDLTFLPLLSAGAVGVISVVTNAIPKWFVEMYQAVEANDLKRATLLHRQFYSFCRDIFVESNPVPIKKAMEWMGVCGPTVRAPLAPMTAASEKILKETMVQCGLLKGGK
ncbi:4-hydroxy-tetrahydrodipicolinate synthase [bacterium]|jgi:4-hydroxy-tetrahydrodipicolinate synthase|nr:4-hydroxy-tetrahydrodipicolinate synthase [bacterium]